jgi:FixJ family two-component response regulator
MNAELPPEERQAIVVVEDDPGMKKAIERLLRAASFQAICFLSAEELLQTNAVDYAACLVLDIHLPGISGLELMKLLVASSRTKPVMFVTGQDNAFLHDEARRLGGDYFRKPFDGKALLEAVRRMVKFDSGHPSP